jgi:hypothetical protein
VSPCGSASELWTSSGAKGRAHGESGGLTPNNALCGAAEGTRPTRRGRRSPQRSPADSRAAVLLTRCRPLLHFRQDSIVELGAEVRVPALADDKTQSFTQREADGGGSSTKARLERQRHGQQAPPWAAPWPSPPRMGRTAAGL